MQRFILSLTLLHLLASLCAPTQLLADQYALLVGVRDYSLGGELNPLKYTEDDVHTLAMTLEESGIPAKKIVVMTQQAAAEDPRLSPRAENIRDIIDALIAKLDSDDLVIVALSGHGVQFKGDPINYFCPLDARLDNKSSLISLTDVYQRLERSRAKTKLLLVDACRNDPIAANARSAAGVALEADNERLLPKIDGGTVALFSCSATQQSFESAELSAGVFFHFINRAFSGEADDDEDMQVDLLELEFFTIKSVQKWARVNLGEKQTPERRGVTSGAVSLVSVPKRLQRQRLDYVTNSVGMKLVKIPAGSFLMGAPATDKEAMPDERPQHQVAISKPFYLSTTEVTQAQWEAVMGSIPSQPLPMVNLGPMFPVVYLTWEEANEFCAKLGKQEGKQYSLPTEAEWEYACRANSTTKFYFAPVADDLDDHAWWLGASGDRTQKQVRFAQTVGQKQPNRFGLFDMIGNVHEWCSDRYAADFYRRSPEVDPVSEQGGQQIARGGSWMSDSGFCRSSHRFYPSSLIRDGKSFDIGFRVKLIVEEQTK